MEVTIEENLTIDENKHAKGYGYSCTDAKQTVQPSSLPRKQMCKINRYSCTQSKRSKLLPPQTQDSDRDQYLQPSLPRIHNYFVRTTISFKRIKATMRERERDTDHLLVGKRQNPNNVYKTLRCTTKANKRNIQKLKKYIG